MEGWKNENSSNKNKFLVGIDVPEFLAGLGMDKDATEVLKAVGDYALFASRGIYGERTEEQNKANGAVQVGRCNVFSSVC